MNKRQQKKQVIPELRTWVALNKAVRDAGVETCQRLLAAELKGRRRKKFLQRIQSRLNRLNGYTAMDAIKKEAK